MASIKISIQTMPQCSSDNEGRKKPWRQSESTRMSFVGSIFCWCCTQTKGSVVTWRACMLTTYLGEGECLHKKHCSYCYPTWETATIIRTFWSYVISTGLKLFPLSEISLPLQCCLFTYKFTIKVSRVAQYFLSSSVSIVSGYGLGDRAIEVRSPAGAKGYLL
jgi:hypothetical protein